jgi:hypothetical protein
MEENVFLHGMLREIARVPVPVRRRDNRPPMHINVIVLKKNTVLSFFVVSLFFFLLRATQNQREKKNATVDVRCVHSNDGARGTDGHVSGTIGTKPRRRQLGSFNISARLRVFPTRTGADHYER